MKKPVIALCSANQGHASLAAAAAAALSTSPSSSSSSQASYQLVSYYHPIIFEAEYRQVYRYFPWFFSIPYRMCNNWLGVQLFRRWYLATQAQPLQAFLDQHQPDLVISTYFGYIPVLAAYQAQTKTATINIIHNPRDSHVLEVANAPALNLGFDETQVQRYHQLAPNCEVKPSGWFVRPEYEQSYSKSALRKKLNLPSGEPILVFVGGSEGTPRLTQIIKGLLSQLPLDFKYRIIVVCGSNQTLLQNFQTLAKTYPQLTALGFSTTLHEYFQAADLVVGKAGPNTLFEAVATLTPFLAITHISGQEDGNLDSIRELQLGFVEERPTQAIQLIIELLHTPQRLEYLQPFLKKTAEYNKQAKRTLSKEVAKLLTHAN